MSDAKTRRAGSVVGAVGILGIAAALAGAPGVVRADVAPGPNPCIDRYPGERCSGPEGQGGTCFEVSCGDRKRSTERELVTFRCVRCFRNAADAAAYERHGPRELEWPDSARRDKALAARTRREVEAGIRAHMDERAVRMRRVMIAVGVSIAGVVIALGGVLWRRRRRAQTLARMQAAAGGEEDEGIGGMGG